MNIPQILNKATRTRWEVFIQRSRRKDIQLRGNDVEASIWSENTGYGIRVIVPGADKNGVGYTSCNSEAQLEAAAINAHELAKVNYSPPFDLPKRRPLPAAKTADRKIISDPDGTVDDYVESLQSILGEEKDIVLTYGKVRAYIVENEITNSQGLHSKSTGTYMFLEMTLKVGGANPTEFWPSRYSRTVRDLDPYRVVTQWLNVAKTALNRRPPRTGRTTVIFSPALVCDAFLPTIGFHASAESVKLGLSKFKPGEGVASDQLTITDDGLYPYGLRTNSFDDEGNPQQHTKLIEKGIFRNYFFDQLHAATMKARPTGNGIRGSWGVDVDERYLVQPVNATTNMVIHPGQKSLDSLIADVDEGIMIYQGAWLNPDSLTTRFQTEIRNAQAITKGQLGEGIVGGAVSGSVLELIQNISGISNRAEIVSGSAFGCVTPYVKFENVQISGPA